MRRSLTSRYSILGLTALVITFGLGVAVMLVRAEESRELARWNEKLNLAADGSARSVTEWVNAQAGELESLAANPALRRYFTALDDAADSSAERAANAPLRDVLMLHAERLGFHPARETADAPPISHGGLVLVALDGTVLDRIGNPPAIEGALAEQIAATPRDTTAMIDMMEVPGGGAQMGFIVPVYAAGVPVQIGSLVAIRPADSGLFGLLSPVRLPETSYEVALLRREADGVRYLSPLLSGKKPLAQREDLGGRQTASTLALDAPGQVKQGRDYRGEAVLATARPIPGTGWAVLVKVDVHEAMATSARQRLNIPIGAALVLVAFASLMVTIWHGAGKRRIAEFVGERDKRNITLSQLVAVLTTLINRRDPFAAKHSEYVAQIATATAHEMGLDAYLVETIETAAKLSNIGKMDVPSEVLKRTTELAADERYVIRSACAKAADLLTGIEFVGPVANTLRFSQEHVNGTGPYRLGGEQIPVTARVVGAANAMVAMLSPRAHRPAMPFDQAQHIIHSLIGEQFDDAVVMAMMRYMYSEAGQQLVQTISGSKPERHLRLVRSA